MSITKTTDSPPRGRYIAIEGDEGAGKTTQASLLADWLREQGKAVQTVREPGGDPWGEALRTVIKDPSLERMPMEELLVFTAARLGMRKRIVKPLLDAGTWVVTDRSEVSTLVYQGLAGGLDLAAITEMQAPVAQVCQPDHFLILDISIELSQQRLVARGETADAFELRGPEYRKLVNDGYRDSLSMGIMGYECSWFNGRGSVGGVQAQLRDHLTAWL